MQFGWQAPSGLDRQAHPASKQVLSTIGTFVVPTSLQVSKWQQWLHALESCYLCRPRAGDMENGNHRKAQKRDEMRDAIWMVVVDLHEHSPFAKAEVDKQGGPVWHLPFHQKVLGLVVHV